MLRVVETFVPPPASVRMSARPWSWMMLVELLSSKVTNKLKRDGQRPALRQECKGSSARWSSVKSNAVALPCHAVMFC